MTELIGSEKADDKFVYVMTQCTSLTEEQSIPMIAIGDIH